MSTPVVHGAAWLDDRFRPIALAPPSAHEEACVTVRVASSDAEARRWRASLERGERPGR